ncbi:SGNH/GDSL hydrolase family protein [Bacteroidaceae bacterium HV4-6-C5C]|jgi:Lysophospholipase L1 and related esterases|nr:SGNH/GDSL hydrolase family protein [Bacteroidaceae bacterium HV4-6-C5C]
MIEKPKYVFVGDSHIALWPLEIYFPKWECFNYGLPGEGMDYIESFQRDVSDCKLVIEFGTNDLYRLNNENIDAYVEHYVYAIEAIPSLQKYLYCILPRNDYSDSSATNRFISRLNKKIHAKIATSDIIYLDVFDRLLEGGRLNESLTVDGLHLNSQGYRILTDCLIDIDKK